MKKINLYGILGGLFLFILLLILPAPAGMELSAWRMVAITALVATWWITDAFDQCITALLPIVLLPIFGITPAAKVTLSYANEAIYLFMGGFMIALAMERSNLHRRFAILTINLMGTKPKNMIFGFMFVCYFLSMWVNNTATVLMVLPIALAIIFEIESASANTPGKYDSFAKSLLLSLAYASSIGGIATLIGTPPNIIFASIMSDMLGLDISFFRWMLFALPISAIMFFFAWFILTHVVYRFNNLTLPISKDFIASEIQNIGKMTTHERRILIVFGSVATLWICRGLIHIPLFHTISDTTIAIAGAISLFLVPAGNKEKSMLLDWNLAKNLPWNILLLFGGGLALSRGFNDSGLSTFLSTSVESLQGINSILLVAILAASVTTLTELMSNTATATLLIPVLITVSGALNLDPMLLVVPVTISASLAFMLPVSTPPNAIIFGCKQVKIKEMIRAGILLNIIGVIVLTIASKLINY